MGLIFWLKQAIFWLKRADFVLKNEQKQGFAVTDSLTGEKYKSLNPLFLQKNEGRESASAEHFFDFFGEKPRARSALCADFALAVVSHCRSFLFQYARLEFNSLQDS